MTSYPVVTETALVPLSRRERINESIKARIPGKRTTPTYWPHYCVLFWSTMVLIASWALWPLGHPAWFGEGFGFSSAVLAVTLFFMGNSLSERARRTYGLGLWIVAVSSLLGLLVALIIFIWLICFWAGLALTVLFTIVCCRFLIPLLPFHL